MTHAPRRAIIPLGLAVALSLPGDATLYAVLPSHPAVAGISIAAVGLILGVNRAIRIFLNTPAGALFDRTGRRRLFLLALVTGALSTAIYALTSGFWPLLAGRLLWGFSWSLILVGSYTIVLDVTTEANRGRWMGIFQSFYLLGGAVGFALGGVLMDLLGYRTTLWVCTGLTTLGLIIAWRSLPETAPDGAPFLTAIRQLRPSRRAFSSTVRRLRGMDRRTQTVNYINFSHYLVGNGVLSSTLGLALSQVSDGSVRLGSLALGVASLTGLLLAVRSVTGIGVAPVAGWLSDYLGDRWILLAWGCTVIVVGFATLTRWETVTAVILGVLLVAAGRGLIVPGLTALAGDMAAVGRKSLSMGGFATSADIGSAVGPIIAYAVATQAGLVWVYAGCIGLMVFAAVLAWMERRAERNLPSL